MLDKYFEKIGFLPIILKETKIKIKITGLEKNVNNALNFAKTLKKLLEMSRLPRSIYHHHNIMIK